MIKTTVIVSACDANSEVRVEDRPEGRVVVVAEQSGGCWYDRAAYRAPISARAAQRMINEYARFVAGPVQQRFLDEATRR